MPNIRTSSDREVGHVTAVSNYSVTVVLDPEIRSQVRSYTRQLSVVTQVGGYLLFPVGPGESAVGIIVWASENEAVEPDDKTGVTLRLARPRRLLRLNLLGLLKEKEPFKPGVSSYPNLETAALLPSDTELKAILDYRSRDTEKDVDTALGIGASAVYGGQGVTASFNDLLGRPLGIIGNTGSGKSWTVASVVQSAIRRLGTDKHVAKVIVLDINGEYSQAFGVPQASRRLNEVYLNGTRFELPLWLFNLAELTSFFGASEASQVPVLERVVTTIREEELGGLRGMLLSRYNILDRAQNCVESLRFYVNQMNGDYVGRNTRELLAILEGLAPGLLEVAAGLSAEPGQLALFAKRAGDCSAQIPEDRYAMYGRLAQVVRDPLEQMVCDYSPVIQELRSRLATSAGSQRVTADSPVPFDAPLLERDAYFMAALSTQRGIERMQEYIATMRLRIHRQLSDRRWSVFTSAKHADGAAFSSLVATMMDRSGAPVTVVDCSMLANDVLPFFCAVFGRILLELREHALPDGRTVQPFALVLEEAHNYLQPPYEGQPAGIRLSRETFERIAKEGRKFGLSLIVASQRPSDVSQTVISQCANFVVHRIQNPDDIEYFKRILPLGSRDLLDQVPILAPGDALLMGSAANVPVRVRVRPPSPPPTSETPKPWRDWQPGKPRFDVGTSIKVWLDEAGASANDKGAGPPADEETEWDSAARVAVEQALENADWDEDTKTVTLHDPRDEGELTVADREQLEEFLREMANEAFCGCVPRADNENMYECDDYGIVDEALAEYEDRLNQFFG